MRDVGGYRLLMQAGISNGKFFCCRHGDEQQQRRGWQCGRTEPGVAVLPDGARRCRVRPVGLCLFLEKLTMYVEEQQVLVIIT